MQMLFELHGLILALHHDARFLRLPGALDRARVGFARALSYYSQNAPAAPIPTAPAPAPAPRKPRRALPVT
jgi:hypothetical protein